MPVTILFRVTAARDEEFLVFDWLPHVLSNAVREASGPFLCSVARCHTLLCDAQNSESQYGAIPQASRLGQVAVEDLSVFVHSTARDGNHGMRRQRLSHSAAPVLQ